jgi:hypothetical protein
MFFGLAANAQYFYANSVTYPEISNTLHKISLLDYWIYEFPACEPTNNTSELMELRYTDMAMDESHVYYVSAWGSLYKGDITNNDSCEFLGTFDTSINSLTVDDGNFLYAAGYQNEEGYIYKYDIANNTIILMGNLPTEVIPSGDLFFYKGHLFLTVTKENSPSKTFLYEINLNAPQESCEHMDFGIYQCYGAFVTDDGSITKAYILTCANGDPITTSLRTIDIENKTVGPVLATFDYLFMGAATSYNNVSTNMVCGMLGLNENYTDASFININNPVDLNQNLKIFTNIDTKNFSIIRLYDITGKYVKNFDSQNLDNLNISDMSSGNYIIEFNFINGEKMMRKLIVK